MRLGRNTGLYLACIAAAAILLVNPGFRRMIRLILETHRLESAIAGLRRENARLRDEVYHLEYNVSYIEKLARKELGVVGQGEVEYRFEKK